MSDRDQNNNFRGQSGQGREQDNTGNLAHGYGDGGDTPFGQLTQGASNQAEGGFGGDNVGGYGQQGMTSQSGQGGPSPLSQGAGYGQGGGKFGPSERDSQSGRAPFGADPNHRGDYRAQGGGNAGASGYQQSGGYRGSESSYAQQDFSPAAQRSNLHQDQYYTGPGHDSPRPGADPHHEDHEPHYRQWRDTQLAAHDRDYARWRDEQTRKYDEDYRGWRGERHTAFSKEFEGWRSNRGGQSSESVAQTAPNSPSTTNATPVHGADPTLTNIAEGHAGDKTS